MDLKPYFLRLFVWIPNFNPRNQKQTNVEVWIWLHGLPQEYWSPKYFFPIASILGVPICLDEHTKSYNFGHYARVLGYIDLFGVLCDHVLVDREWFGLYLVVDYEKLHSFYSFFS